MNDDAIRTIVQRIQEKIETYQADETAELYGLNEYDAIEAVLKEVFKEKPDVNTLAS